MKMLLCVVVVALAAIAYPAPPQATPHVYQSGDDPPVPCPATYGERCNEVAFLVDSLNHVVRVQMGDVDVSWRVEKEGPWGLGAQAVICKRPLTSDSVQFTVWY